MSVRLTFWCDNCGADAIAVFGSLPRGWFAAGPTVDGTKYPTNATTYACSSTCLLAFTEKHVAELRAREPRLG